MNKSRLFCLIIICLYLMISVQAQDSRFSDGFEEITINNISELEIISQISMGQVIAPLSFTVHGDKLIFGGSSSNLVTCDLPCNNFEIRDAGGTISDVEITADGEWLAAGIFSFNNWNVVAAWQSSENSETPRLLMDEAATRAGVTDIAVNNRDKVVATAGEDGQIRAWDFSSQELLVILPATGVAVRTVAYTPNGEYLFASSPIEPYELDTGSGVMQVWDTANYQLVQEWIANPWFSGDIAFSPNGQFMASAGGNNQGGGMTELDAAITIWDISSLEEDVPLVATLLGHTYNTRSLAYAPNGTILASAASDDTIRFWDTTSYQQIQLLEAANGIYDVAWHESGHLFFSLSGDDGSYFLRIWAILKSE